MAYFKKRNRNISLLKSNEKTKISFKIKADRNII